MLSIVGKSLSRNLFLYGKASTDKMMLARNIVRYSATLSADNKGTLMGKWCSSTTVREMSNSFELSEFEEDDKRSYANLIQKVQNEIKVVEDKVYITERQIRRNKFRRAAIIYALVMEGIVIAYAFMWVTFDTLLFFGCLYVCLAMFCIF